MALIPDVQVEQKGHRIKLNPAAYELLHRVYNAIASERSGRPQRIGFFSGVFNDELMTRAFLSRLKKLVEQHRGIAKPVIRLARAFRGAAADSGTVIVYTKEAALIHEGFHRASELGSRLAVATLRGRHARFEELAAHPAFVKAREALLKKGYFPSQPLLVEEAAAYIWEGDYKGLRLTKRKRSAP